MFDAQTDSNAAAAPTLPTAPSSPPVAGTSTQPEYPFRLLPDETVLAMYPLVQAKMKLGKIASFVFMTDSRLIYSAEANTIVSSSTHHREFQIATIKGLEVGRQRGLTAMGAAAILGSIINFVGLILLTIIFAALQNDFTTVLAVICGILAAFVLIFGLFNLSALRVSATSLSVVGPEGTIFIAGHDTSAPVSTFTVLALFGPLVGIASLLRNKVRSMGIVQAHEAQQFASAENIDRIAYEAGALILDIQARGTLVGKA